MDRNTYIIKRFKVISRHDNMPYAVSKKFNRNALSILYEEFGFTSGAEIGVSKGKYAKIILDGAPSIERYYCIDPYAIYKARKSQERQDRIYKFAVNYLTNHGFEDKVRFIRKPSLEAVKDFRDETLDFIYIDGNHEFDYVMMDLIQWAKKVKKGGIVALHDYCHFHWAGIIKAVDAYVYCHDIRPWFITKEEKATVFWVK